MNLRNFVLHPDRFFTALCHLGSCRAGLLLLLIMSAAVGASVVADSWCGRYRRRRTEPSLSLFFGPACFVFFGQFLTASLGLALAQAAGSALSFNSVLNSAAFAVAPLWLHATVAVCLGSSWLSHRIAVATLAAAMVWSTFLLWCGVQASSSGALWQGIVALLPTAVGAWAVLIAVICSGSSELRTLRPWRTLPGKSVLLFYPRDLPSTEATSIIDVLDLALADAAAALDLEPLKQRVGVFLFPDQERLNKETGHSDSPVPAAAMSHGDAISLALPVSDEFRLCAVHEFTHVMLYQRVGRSLNTFLNEGLATHIEETVCVRRRDRPSLSVSWPMMARYTVFMQEHYAKGAEISQAAAYAYAGSVVEFLVRQFGMKQYLNLCRVCQSEPEHLAGSRLDAAVQKVYGKSAAELEAEWRTASAASVPSGAGDLRYVRQIAALEARVRALEAEVSGQRRLDLWDGPPRD